MLTVFLPLLLAAFVAPWAGRRLPPRALGWLLLPGPLAALLIAASLPDGGRLVFPWVPEWGFSVSFALDGLGRLFAFLILGVGVLITAYAGYYFDGEKGAGRFFCLLFLFMAAMTALVMAGDLLTLFVAWEATSVLSFLLVGFHREDPVARRAALRALVVTGGGGIALLLGLIGLAKITGAWDIPSVLAAGQALKSHPAYPAVFALIVLGAATKSAQVPFHRWLPGAMAAPTPASAYLHSATMVKAGIFLLMRLHPALGGTDLWFWTLSALGLATLLGGAWRGLGEMDLKALLAQSTLSQLGALTLLAAQDTPTAFKALVIGLSAHGLYKSALFMIVGVVDHAAGTRDLERLGGLKHALPGAAVVGFLAALSLAGFPPMMGFLAKETLFATVSHPDVPAWAGRILTGGAVLAAAFLIAQAARFYVGIFEGPERNHAHQVPTFFWAAAAPPAALSTALAVFPEPRFLGELFAGAAGAAFGAPVKVSLALWTGLTLPLVLSLVAVGAGVALAAADRRGWLHPWAVRLRWGDRKESFLIRLFDGAAAGATALQAGKGRFYWAVVLAAGLALLTAGGLPAIGSLPFWPGSGLRAVALIVAAAGALGTLIFSGRGAILSLGVSGLGIAVVLAAEPAPDVALVQLLADLLLVVLLLSAWPGLKAGGAPSSKTGPALLALGWGAAGTALSAWALYGRPRFSALAPAMSEMAKPRAGSTDIVGAIVVEFRGWDTLIEIAVFAVAGLAAWALLERRTEPTAAPASTSPLLAAAARALVPLSLLFAFVHVAFGHDRPGDGFTAGVLVALSLGLYDRVLGPGAAAGAFRWLKPERLISVGLLLVVVRLIAPWAAGGEPLAPFEIWGRDGFSLSGGLAFEFGIFLTVLGAAARMGDAHHPTRDLR